MQVLHSPNLAFDLSNSNLFLDTNTFIGAINYPGIFDGIFKNLKNKGCAFLTIPSVLFEFTRGTQSIEDFNRRAEYLENLCQIFMIERLLDRLEDFVIVLQRIGGRMSYTDFLLCACLYKFPDSFLLTENHEDFPLSILARTHLITIDTDKEVRTYGIYRLSIDKFKAAAQNILGNKEIPF